jgi:hypothetical protein
MSSSSQSPNRQSKFNATTKELQKFKKALAARIKGLSPGREDEAMWHACHPEWKLSE